MANKLKIAVLGGGVIGVTTALRIITNFPNSEVILMSHEYSPNTTSDSSSGLWLPYSQSMGAGVSEDKYKKWSDDSFNFFVKIANSLEAKDFGVSFVKIHFIAENRKDIPIDTSKIEGREMSEDELSIYPSKYRFGKCGLSVHVECKKLLPKLIEKFHSMGGSVARRKLHKLHELIGEYDVVANCAGLNSAFLVPDPSVYPIRGQVVKVKAPWIKHCVVEKEFYIIPNQDIVTLGGTSQDDDWNISIDNDDKDRIINGTGTILPSLLGAEHKEDWVGLRPGRECPRVERDYLSKNSTVLHVIHNYGHGGAGITLSWGCAGDVVHLLNDVLQETSLTSRL